MSLRRKSLGSRRALCSDGMEASLLLRIPDGPQEEYRIRMTGQHEHSHRLHHNFYFHLPPT
jgi:hypothetical protein